MDFAETVFLSTELIGTVSFAISGSMVAIQKRTDFFGVLFLGAATAVGGGIFRDLLLGNTPPIAFIDRKYVLIALLTSLILFVAVRCAREQYIKWEQHLGTINNVFDAIGLGIFAVVGVQAGIRSGQSDNLFFCLFLGLVTGVGGGITRDLMLCEIPFVLKKRIYAVATLLGSGSYWCLTQIFSQDVATASAVSVLLVFVIRMLSTKYRWSLPKAIE